MHTPYKCTFTYSLFHSHQLELNVSVSVQFAPAYSKLVLPFKLLDFRATVCWLACSLAYAFRCAIMGWRWSMCCWTGCCCTLRCVCWIFENDSPWSCSALSLSSKPKRKMDKIQNKYFSIAEMGTRICRCRRLRRRWTINKMKMKYKRKRNAIEFRTQNENWTHPHTRTLHTVAQQLIQTATECLLFIVAYNINMS